MSGLVRIERPADGEPDGALVLLHGRGADEHDLVPFLDLLDPRRRLLAITPGGPLALPPGGRHWYVVARIGHPDPETFAASYELLQRELDVPWERTIVGGFSQGAVMSYALALGRGRPTPAGLLAMSGFMPTVPGVWEPDLDRPGLPVLLTHGRRDPVIGVEFARRAEATLREAGIAVEYHETEAGHHVDPRVLALLPDWVERVLPPA